ncbi:MAG: alanine--tRNA ligase [Chloroflexi bacterium]|nr:alanine--tRNA ligase [Chloroflexota bacterium]
MTGDEIRSSYIRFFEGEGHLHMPSASLIPAGDPTLLFTSAGMVPFKPFFMGEQTPPNRRMTSFQKSFRTTDIDEVGDHKHLTFFEMLGNFSIGDYFKQDAIAFAWELVTGLFSLPPERLYVTIHLDDDEAYALWRDNVGVPDERIYRYGDSDNWWGPAGTEGPTGPCSEIHYDGGAEMGCGSMVPPNELTDIFLRERETGTKQDIPGCHPNCDCERFVELWNLVFMQFYQDPERNRTLLPAPSVDTGMGLERAAAVLQNKPNVYETDIFRPILDKVCGLSGKAYGQDRETDYALRVVAEHARAASFLIGDGVVPGNEGRGYVLRRVIRRAIRYGRRLGLAQTFLTQVAEVVLERFAPVYRELDENGEFILRVIGLEEERFSRTFERGNDILRGMVAYRERALMCREHIVQSGIVATALPDDHLGGSESENMGAQLARQYLVEAAGDEPSRPDANSVLIDQWGSVITGKEAFVLYDTYGFPPELTAEIARERGLEVDTEGFEREMESQREQSRSSQGFSGAMEMLTAYENLGIEATHFVGYRHLEQETQVAALLVDNVAAGHATQGQSVEVLLEDTPFYAENGGQVGDQGVLNGPNGTVRVEDTQSPVAGLIVHRGVVEKGDISLGDTVSARVDISRRLDAARNHSGTHLLHASLRSVLGPHVRQAGSMVAPDRLRFDFSHVGPLSPEEQLSVQNLANAKVRDNLEVSTQESTYAEAVRDGALAFFGDRYGDTVRVVRMSNGEAFSVEVCGGTHVGATGQVGTLFVLGESGIGGGMRRIEAVTGRAAEQLFVEQSERLDALARRLQTPVVDLEARLETFIQDTEELRRRLATLERGSLRSEAEALLEQVQDIGGVKVVAGRTSANSAEAMREMGDFIKTRVPSAVICLGAVVNGNPLLVAMVTPDLVDKGLHAGNMVRDAARVMGGGGGGQPEMAQAGGRQADKLQDALRRVAELVGEETKS